MDKKALIKMGIGTVVGAALGYAYYKFIGCASGGCPITSNPVISTIYGAVFGLVITYKRPVKPREAEE